jgi:hypothetical protein
MNDYRTVITVDQSPAQVFAAVNDVRSWWTGDITGGTTRVGDEFTYSYEDVHRSTQRITELVPDHKVVWLVTEATLTFTADPREWVGTEIVFDIASRGPQTELRFTHVGLNPDVECFGACSGAWSQLVNDSLRRRISLSPQVAATSG